jgi:hypothetical protein
MKGLALSTFHKHGVVFVDFDQVDERLDAEVRERHELFVAKSVDPDHAVLGIHFHSDVVQPVDALAEIGGDAIDGCHTVNFVDVHDLAAM